MIVLEAKQQENLDWKLCRAVEKDDVDAIYDAVESGAAGDSILGVRAGQMNMLAWACITSSMKSVDTLIGLRVDVNGGDGLSPLIAAIIARSKSSLIDRLIDAGADVDKPGAMGRTPLIYAVLHNNEWAVGTLLHRGAITVTEDNHGKSAIDYAVQLGHERIAEMLHSALLYIPRRSLAM